MSSKRGDKKNQKIPKMEQHFLIGPKIGYLIFLFFKGLFFLCKDKRRSKKNFTTTPNSRSSFLLSFFFSSSNMSEEQNKVSDALPDFDTSSVIHCLHPEITWAETPDIVYITVKLNEECNFNVSMAAYDNIKFTAVIARRGDEKSVPKVPKVYAFSLFLKEEVCAFNIRRDGFNVLILLGKVNVEWWFRLTKSTKKNQRIKTDFKRFNDPETYNEPEEVKMDLDFIAKGIIGEGKKQHAIKLESTRKQVVEQTSGSPYEDETQLYRDPSPETEDD